MDPEVEEAAGEGGENVGEKLIPLKRGGFVSPLYSGVTAIFMALAHTAHTSES